MDDQKTKTTRDLADLPGIKESALVKLGTCRVCGKQQLAGQMPLFYRVTISRAGFLIDAVKRRAALGTMLGSQALGQVMGPDEDLAKVIDGPHEVFVHEHCAGKIGHLLDLIPDGDEKEDPADASE